MFRSGLQESRIEFEELQDSLPLTFVAHCGPLWPMFTAWMPSNRFGGVDMALIGPYLTVTTLE